MTAILRRRRVVYLTVAEWCARTGEKPNTVRWQCRHGLRRCKDLNEGTGKRSRLRLYASDLPNDARR